MRLAVRSGVGGRGWLVATLLIGLTASALWFVRTHSTRFSQAVSASAPTVVFVVLDTV